MLNKMQQYQSADGSIWEQSYSDEALFVQVEGPNGSHVELAPSPLKLPQVLQGWGALTLYEPWAKVKKGIRAILLEDLGWEQDVDKVDEFVNDFTAALRQRGFKITEDNKSG